MASEDMTCTWCTEIQSKIFSHIKGKKIEAAWVCIKEENSSSDIAREGTPKKRGGIQSYNARDKGRISTLQTLGN